jgi:hypothetical protein
MMEVYEKNDAARRPMHMILKERNMDSFKRSQSRIVLLPESVLVVRVPVVASV